MALKAEDKGSLIEISKNDLDVKIGNVGAPFDISMSGGLNIIKLSVPQVNPGRYEAKLSLIRSGIVYADSFTLDYPVLANGKMIDKGKPVSAEIIFIAAGHERYKAYTDQEGVYNISVVPDAYDVKFVFPQSSIVLERGYTGSFNNPMKYSFFQTPIGGVSNPKIFAYDVSIPFYRARIEMPYKNSDYKDESRIVALKCSNWGESSCISSWVEIAAEIDSSSNTVVAYTDSFSAFAVGEKDSIKLTLSMPSRYKAKDLAKIRGIASDLNGDPVGGVNVTIKIGDLTAKTKSDENGVFLLEFVTPDVEGNYSVAMTGSKKPYSDYQLKSTVEIVRSKSISVLMPDSVKIAPGDNYTQEILVLNTGQADIEGIELDVVGINKNYFFILPLIEKLEAGGRKSLSMEFFVPSTATEGTVEGILKVSGGGIVEEKSFGFTITPKIQEKIKSPAGLAISLPSVDLNVLYLMVFAVASFSLAMLLRSRKKMTVNPQSQIFEVKNFMKKSEEEYRNRSSGSNG